MARHKVIVNTPEKAKHALAKKRERIRRTADCIYLVLLFSAILIMGINQFNRLIVGWGMIAIGLFSAPAAFFHLYVIEQKWMPAFWYDPVFSHLSREEKEKRLFESRFCEGFIAVSLILSAIAAPVFGILRLRGIA